MLLAIDTATARASVALHDGTALRGECTWEAHNRHTVTLFPQIVQLLHTVNLTPADLSALAVCIGPGSYTGVRIGVAAAKGMVAAHPVPLVGVTTLDILASAQPPDARPLYATFAAGRKRVGYARYAWVEAGWHAQSDVAVATWTEFAEHIAAGDEPGGALVVGEIGGRGRAELAKLDARVHLPAPARHLRRAGYLADLAWPRVRAGDVDAPETLQALYAR